MDLFEFQFQNGDYVLDMEPYWFVLSQDRHGVWTLTVNKKTKGLMAKIKEITMETDGPMHEAAHKIMHMTGNPVWVGDNLLQNKP